MKALTSLLFILGISFLSFAQNGKLNDAKESLKEKPSTSTTTTARSNSSSRRSSSVNSSFDSGNPLLDLTFLIAFNLTYGIVVESVFELNSRMHSAQISTPNHYGSFIYDDVNDVAFTRLDISNALVIEDKNLYGNHLNLNFRFAKRFDLEVGYLQLIERVNRQTEGFSLMTSMLNYHRVRTQRVDLWFGLGAMYVANDVKEFGFAYGGGIELFVAKPISILASYKGSSINSREVSKSKVLLNYHLKKYRISSGYEHFSLGVSSIGAFSLGLRLSF